MGNRIFKSSSAYGDRKYIVNIVGGLPTILLEIEPAGGRIMKSYTYADSEILMQYDGSHLADKYFYLHERMSCSAGRCLHTVPLRLRLQKLMKHH
jgi:hypothetical protein